MGNVGIDISFDIFCQILFEAEIIDLEVHIEKMAKLSW